MLPVLCLRNNISVPIQMLYIRNYRWFQSTVTDFILETFLNIEFSTLKLDACIIAKCLIACIIHSNSCRRIIYSNFSPITIRYILQSRWSFSMFNACSNNMDAFHSAIHHVQNSSSAMMYALCTPSSISGEWRFRLSTNYASGMGAVPKRDDFVTAWWTNCTVGVGLFVGCI